MTSWPEIALGAPTIAYATDYAPTSVANVCLEELVLPRAAEAVPAAVCGCQLEINFLSR